MNNEYQYKLASGKFSKIDCPKCGKKKHWQRYYNTAAGEVLPEKFGKCDNTSKCSWHSDPYKEQHKKLLP